MKMRGVLKTGSMLLAAAGLFFSAAVTAAGAGQPTAEIYYDGSGICGIDGLVFHLGDGFEYRSDISTDTQCCFDCYYDDGSIGEFVDIFLADPAEITGQEVLTADDFSENGAKYFLKYVHSDKLYSGETEPDPAVLTVAGYPAVKGMFSSSIDTRNYTVSETLILKDEIMVLVRVGVDASESHDADYWAEQILNCASNKASRLHRKIRRQVRTASARKLRLLMRTARRP